MTSTTEGHRAPGSKWGRWGRRLGWLLGLWLLGVVGLGLLAWLLRGVMAGVGLALP